MSDDTALDTLPHKEREKWLDLFRLTALLYMFFYHAVLVLLDPVHNTGFIKALYDMVPVCGAMFLFASGYSLSLMPGFKDRQARFRSMKKNALRAFVLIAASIVLFIMEYGPQFPFFLTSSGILSTIGLFIMLGSLLLCADRPFLTVILASSVLVILYLAGFFSLPVLRALTMGYEAPMPTILYGLIGLTCGLSARTYANIFFFKKLVPVISLILGSILVLVYGAPAGYPALFSDGLGTAYNTLFFDTRLMPLRIITGSIGGYLEESVWNYNVTGFTAALGWVLVLYGIMSLSGSYIKKSPDILLIPGQTALVNYILHLAVLAVIVTAAGYNALGLPMTMVVLGLMMIAAWAVSYIAVKLSSGFRRRQA